MSNSFTDLGVVIHSSPCVGCHAVPWPYFSMLTLLNPYSFARRAITSLSRYVPSYSDGSRTRWYGTISRIVCSARSPDASLMMAVI
jgi:hypothetical protein